MTCHAYDIDHDIDHGIDYDIDHDQYNDQYHDIDHYIDHDIVSVNCSLDHLFICLSVQPFIYMTNTALTEDELRHFQNQLQHTHWPNA